ncbi:MAG: CapA family protein [Firmicutes bacterium]|nr:CapA family protein [Bacillota bacterium]
MKEKLWQEKTLAVDVSSFYTDPANIPSDPFLEITLKNKSLSIKESGSLLWASDAGILVQDFLWADIDHDANRELIVLCWRRGSFGDHHPFWVKKNDHDWGEHIFIYDYLPENTVYPNKIHPIWMSSAVPLQMVSFSFDEAKEALYIEDTAGRISGWAWLSWGLELISEHSQVSFLCAGDALMHRSVYTDLLLHPDHFDAFLAQTPSPSEEGSLQDLIRQADLAFFGQETPLVSDPDLYGSYPSFGTPLEMGELLAGAGFDGALCSTNHALDRGLTGIDTTADFYESRGVCPLGIQKSSNQEKASPYMLLDREGIRFALFDCTYGTNGLPLPGEAPFAVSMLDDADLRQNLKKAREEADLVIVFVHWGTEYADQPDELQKTYSDLFLEEGVDVVVGSHPHVVQPVCQRVRDDGHEMLVFYSLGNLISGNQEPAQNSGAVASFTIEKADGKAFVVSYKLYKINSIYGDFSAQKPQTLMSSSARYLG